MVSRPSLRAVGLSCLASIALIAPARCATLAELIAGGTLQTDQLVFGEFTYATGEIGPAAADVAVSTFDRLDGTTGLRFEGDFQSTVAGEVQLSYHATSRTDEAMLRASLTADLEAGLNSTIVVREALVLRSSVPTLSLSARSGAADTAREVRLPTAAPDSYITTTIRFTSASGNPASISFFEQGFLLSDVADFNADGVVDGGDFLAWQRGVSQASFVNHSTGDSNGDGSVNSADLSVWSAQFGAGGAQAALAAVPEPTAMVMIAMLASVGAAWVRRRDRRC